MRKRLSGRYKETGSDLLGYFTARPVLNTLVQIRVAVLVFAAISGQAPAALCDSINKWTGGTGNWSDAANWSAGTVPTSTDDVVITSAVGNEARVNLDSAASVRSLSLGPYSFLNSDRETCLVSDCALKIAGALNVSSTGNFEIYGETVNAFTLNSAGEVYLNGGTLNLQTPIIDLAGNLSLANPYASPALNLVDVQGRVLGSALTNLTTIEPGPQTELFLSDNKTLTITPIGGTLTNYGNLTTYYPDTVLNIVGSLRNLGFVSVDGTVNVRNVIKDVPASSGFTVYGQFNRVDSANKVLAGGLSDVTTIEGGVFFMNGRSNVIAGSLTLSSSGSLGLESGTRPTSLKIAGDLDNAGRLVLNNNEGSTGIMSVDGTITNEKLGSIALYGGTLSAQRFVNYGTLVESISASYLYPRCPWCGVVESYGKIDAHGLVSLDGTLDVQLENDFLPANGEKFYILSFESGDLLGRFPNITGDVFNNGTQRWDISYLDQCFPNAEGGCVYLEAEANVTPEPASILLVILGAATVLSAYKFVTNRGYHK